MGAKNVAKPDDLELTAMMCSRLCHDLISPVGAIANGFEVLDDENDESMREMALDIIRANGRKASSRLQFARLAFGAMGATTDKFPLDEARRLTEGLYEDEKVSISWLNGPAALPKDQVKLLVNLIIIAAQAVPRGGKVSVSVDGEDDLSRIVLIATGPQATIPGTAQAIFEGNPPDGRIDAHNIQPYYATRLAESVGARVEFRVREDAVEVVAERTA
jgi:histidine phosphotransferase ChpT